MYSSLLLRSLLVLLRSGFVHVLFVYVYLHYIDINVYVHVGLCYAVTNMHVFLCYNIYVYCHFCVYCSVYYTATNIYVYCSLYYTVTNIYVYCSLYHNAEHSHNIYKRTINPLTETEYKSTYLFADPNKADASRQRHTALQMSQTTLS